MLGPGDVGEDRLVPDCYRAWLSGAAVHVRNPESVRPWQHVLEPLSGYLQLASAARAGSGPQTCNFGPGTDGHRTAITVVRSLAACAPKERRSWIVAPAGVHEARSLALCIDRARNVLRWGPRLTFAETVEWTDAGYSAARHKLPRVIERQLADYASREPLPCFAGVSALPDQSDRHA